MWVGKWGNKISVCDVWLIFFLSLPSILWYSCFLFFSTVIAPLCSFSLLCLHLSILAIWLWTELILSKDHPPTSTTFFLTYFTYSQMHASAHWFFVSFILYLSLFPSLSSCSSRVQLPVSGPLCLNSINSQRTCYASVYQSACMCVLYLCMQALSTLCKCTSLKCGVMSVYASVVSLSLSVCVHMSFVFCFSLSSLVAVLH